MIMKVIMFMVIGHVANDNRIYLFTNFLNVPNANYIICSIKIDSKLELFL